MPNLVAYHAIGGMINNLDSMLARPEMRYLPRGVQQVWVQPPIRTRRVSRKSAILA